MLERLVLALARALARRRLISPPAAVNQQSGACKYKGTEACPLLINTIYPPASLIVLARIDDQISVSAWNQCGICEDGG